jgi:hypothetical protein
MKLLNCVSIRNITFNNEMSPLQIKPLPLLNCLSAKSHRRFLGYYKISWGFRNEPTYQEMSKWTNG